MAGGVAALTLLFALPGFSQEAAHDSVASDGGAGRPRSAENPPAKIRVMGRTLFELSGTQGIATPADRARAASAILAAILEEGGDPDVSVTSADGSKDHLSLKVGEREVLRLGPEDVAASGLAPEVFAESIRAQVQSFLRAEHHRGETRSTVLTVCMVILMGLLSFLAIRWISSQRHHLRLWLERKADTERGERMRTMLVLSRQALEGGAYVLANLTAWLTQIAIVLGYVVFVLSQFVATRGLIAPLLATLFGPFGDLLQRFVRSLPTAVVLVAAFYLVLAGARLLRFFLDRVASGRFVVGWLPADLATPLRPWLQGALVLLALLLLGPLVSSSHDGLLSRLGELALAALFLAAVPLCATLLLGAFVVLSRRYVPGQWIEIGRHAGEVTEVTFFELRLVPLGAGLIRLPHLLSLFVPVRQLPGPPVVEIDLPLSPAVDPVRALEVLARSVPERFGKAELSLRSFDASAAVYRLRLLASHADPRTELMPLLAAALAEAGVPLATWPTAVAPERGS